MEDPTSPSSKSILVVDDEDTIGEFFKTILGREGFKVVVANTGKAALERMKSKVLKKIDLAVVDLMMPAPGGYDVIKEIQKAEYGGVPVYVVTGRTLDQGTIDMLRLEANVQEFWKKPVDPVEFAMKVHGLLGTVRKTLS